MRELGAKSGGLNSCRRSLLTVADPVPFLRDPDPDPTYVDMPF